jgi:hypothetical protein
LKDIGISRAVRRASRAWPSLIIDGINAQNDDLAIPLIQFFRTRADDCLRGTGDDTSPDIAFHRYGKRGMFYPVRL